MRGKKRKILIASLSIIIIIFIILLAIGNYFFEYALVRNDVTTTGATRNISSDIPSETQKIIDENYEYQTKITNSWLKTENKQNISVTSKDNLQLNAIKFVANNRLHNYAIITHGYSQNKDSVMDIANQYHNAGYNVIVPDLRAHGESAGKYVGMGWLDKNDILKWIELILNEDSHAKIVLHGVSMGAATVMMASGENLPENVTAVIEDCGYTSVKEVFSSELKLRFNLPPFPIINSASFVSSFRAGYSFDEASSLEQIKKSDIPTLFIHGSADNFIPVEMCHKLYDSATCKKEKLIINGAGHAQSRFLAPDEYYHAVFNFINNKEN